MRERRKNFRVEWNSCGKIYRRDGRFAFKWWRQDYRCGTWHSSGRVHSPHFTSRPRPRMSRHLAFKGRFGGGIC